MWTIWKTQQSSNIGEVIFKKISRIIVMGPRGGAHLNHLQVSVGDQW